MRVFLDESGDMGWTFTKPYRVGGSSRYLCLAFLFLPETKKKIARNLMSELYRKYEWTSERKASDAVESQLMDFAERVLAMLAANPDVKIDCIVCKKENVQPHIRDDENKIYNYMCKLIIPDHVRGEPFFRFHPDKRAIKVESGRSLPHYLEMVLGFDLNSPVRLIYEPQESTFNRSLHFVDWMAHCVWRKYEDANSPAFDRLYPAINVRRLFFNS